MVILCASASKPPSHRPIRAIEKPTMRLTDENSTVVVAAARISSLALTDPAPLRRGDRNTVIRCRIDGSGSVRTVVIKAAHGLKHLLANEAAGLRLLGCDHRTRAMAPRLLMYEAAARLMIMEAVPSAKSLAELLMGITAWRR